MYKTKKLVLKTNGKPSILGIEIDIRDSSTKIESLYEALKEDGRIKHSGNLKFFNREGNEITDDNFILLADNDIIYIETQPGKAFDYTNILEEYKVLEILGKGGFGQVHKAEHVLTKSVVAIKYIDITDCIYHASKVEEIYREAQALKKFNHPCIVKLHHAFLSKNNVVLIMEYVAGGELYAYVKNKPMGLSEIEARDLFRQLVEAVEYCHNKYVIHRDLKPANILLTDATGKNIKLIDFGIAGNNYGKFKDSSKAGSLAYMPPEVLLSTNTSSDPAIDVWAMGIILYFMLWGHLPFRGKTEKEIVKFITTQKVIFPAEKKKISEECKKLILGMLNKNPKLRTKTSDILQSGWFLIPDEKLLSETPKTVVQEEEKTKEDIKLPINLAKLAKGKEGAKGYIHHAPAKSAHLSPAKEIKKAPTKSPGPGLKPMLTPIKTGGKGAYLSPKPLLVKPLPKGK